MGDEGVNCRVGQGQPCCVLLLGCLAMLQNLYLWQGGVFGSTCIGPHAGGKSEQKDGKKVCYEYLAIKSINFKEQLEKNSWVKMSSFKGICFQSLVLNLFAAISMRSVALIGSLFIHYKQMVSLLIMVS